MQIILVNFKLFSQNLLGNFHRTSLRNVSSTSNIFCSKMKCSLTIHQMKMFTTKGFNGKIRKGLSSSLFKFLVGTKNYVAAADSCKEVMIYLSRILSRQWRVHTSQKIHRGLELYSYSTRMFGEEATRKMLRVFKRLLVCKSSGLLMSAMCLIPFDWDKNRITDDQLENCVKEYESLESLCNSTIICQDCFKRQVFDQEIQDIEYCACNGFPTYADKSKHYDGWEAFLERDNILVWRRKVDDSSLFSYKVFGSYDDLSLSAFMETQLNSCYRTAWDTSVLELKVVDSHQDSNSDLLYWLVKFPHFFANRDYVFKRRYRVDEARKEVVIVNEITTHELLPEVAGVHRVQQYWSKMVLKAKDDFNKPGLSYSLTYFDNPGTNLPSAVTSFVACSAFPDFLSKVHKATLNLQSLWENGEDVYVNLPANLRYKKDKDPKPLQTPSKDATATALVQASVSFSPEEDDDGKDSSYDRHQDALIHLLEAMEVFCPGSDEASGNNLTEKLEVLMDKLGLEGVRKNLFMKRLENLRKKTQNFLKNSAKKKQESLRRMAEVETKRSRYDYDRSPQGTEPTLVLFSGLLNAVNEIMLEDKDMRTGKIFLRDGELNSRDTLHPYGGEKEMNSTSNISGSDQGSNRRESLHPNCREKETNLGSNLPEVDQSSMDKLTNSNSEGHRLINWKTVVSPDETCQCCTCDSWLFSQNNNNNKSWYSFIQQYFWQSRESQTAEKRRQFCANCICEHKTLKSKGGDVTEECSTVGHKNAFDSNEISPSDTPLSYAFQSSNRTSSGIIRDRGQDQNFTQSKMTSSYMFFFHWYKKLWGYIF